VQPCHVLQQNMCFWAKSQITSPTHDEALTKRHQNNDCLLQETRKNALAPIRATSRFSMGNPCTRVCHFMNNSGTIQEMGRSCVVRCVRNASTVAGLHGCFTNTILFLTYCVTHTCINRLCTALVPACQPPGLLVRLAFELLAHGDSLSPLVCAVVNFVPSFPCIPAPSHGEPALLLGHGPLDRHSFCALYCASLCVHTLISRFFVNILCMQHPAVGHL
jgi:hypothetical protein